jgi:hypothetical protein
MNIKLLEMLPLDISKKIMAISIANFKKELIQQYREALCCTIFKRIDGIQTKVYNLYADGDIIVYYIEKLKKLNGVSVYIRTIVGEWIAWTKYEILLSQNRLN